MDSARLRLLQAVEHVLTEKRPNRDEIQRLRDYAKTDMPIRTNLPP